MAVLQLQSKVVHIRVHNNRPETESNHNHNLNPNPKKLKSNYFIVRPKVDHWELANLVCRTPEISAVLQRSQHLPLPRKHSPEGDTAAQQCRTSS